MRKFDPVKHEGKRAEILAASERCFVRNGFHGATIAQICDEAGISPGHLYHYFASKEAIIGAITESFLEHTRSRFAEIEEDTNPITTLVSEFERLRAHNRETGPGVLLDLLAEAGRNPAIGEILRQTSQEMRRMMADFLVKGQNRGEIDPNLDADMAAAVLISIIDSSKTLSVRDPNLDAKRSAKTLDLMITRFLSAPEA